MSAFWEESGLPPVMNFGPAFSASFEIPNAVIYVFDLTPQVSNTGTQSYAITAAGNGTLTNGGTPVAGPTLRTLDNTIGTLPGIPNILACEVVLQALPYTPEEAAEEEPPSRLSQTQVNLTQDDGSLISHSAFLVVDAPGQCASVSWVLPGPSTDDSFHSLVAGQFVSNKCRLFGVIVGAPAA